MSKMNKNDELYMLHRKRVAETRYQYFHADEAYEAIIYEMEKVANRGEDVRRVSLTFVASDYESKMGLGMSLARFIGANEEDYEDFAYKCMVQLDDRLRKDGFKTVHALSGLSRHWYLNVSIKKPSKIKGYIDSIKQSIKTKNKGDR